MRDDTAEHQIRVFMHSAEYAAAQRIAVSCTCLAIKRKTGGPTAYEPIETRSRWDAPEGLAVWRAHVEAVPNV